MIHLEQKERGLLITLTNKEDYQELFDKHNGYIPIGELLDDSRYLGNNWFDCTGLVGLTDSPIIGYDCAFDDEGNLTNGGNFYWFPNYQIINPLETLLNEGEVFFSLGE
jgi:hypothetical protein